MINQATLAERMTAAADTLDGLAAVDLQIARYDLPPVPSPSPGDEPVFAWHTLAEVEVNGLVGTVRRFIYWDERDGQPVEIGFESHINGLPETAGIADVVATHPDVLADLAAVSNKVAEILREAQG